MQLNNVGSLSSPLFRQYVIKIQQIQQFIMIERKNKSQDKSMSDKKYHMHELVWAKLRGFPWWPGKIIGMSIKNPQKYAVHFSEQGRTYYLKQKKLYPYLLGQNGPMGQQEMTDQLHRIKQLFNNELRSATQHQEQQNNHQDNSKGKNKLINGNQQKNGSKNKSFPKQCQKIKIVKPNLAKMYEQQIQTPKRKHINTKRERKNSEMKNNDQKQFNSQNLKRWYVDLLIKKGIQKRVAMQISANLLKNEKFNEMSQFTSNAKIIRNMSIQEIRESFFTN